MPLIRFVSYSRGARSNLCGALSCAQSVQEAINLSTDEMLAVVARAILNNPWALQVKSFTL